MASDFHAKCDNKGATITVIRSTDGFMFGGFSDKPCTSSNKYCESDKAFLFFLRSHQMKLDPQRFVQSKTFVPELRTTFLPMVQGLEVVLANSTLRVIPITTSINTLILGLPLRSHLYRLIYFWLAPNISKCQRLRYSISFDYSYFDVIPLWFKTSPRGTVTCHN